jgi:metallo-beta-lactamase family protein
MQQGRDLFENEPIPVPPAELDFVLLTHAHIDHAGLLPLLWKQGFRGSVYTSSATVQLCDIMLCDSANIQQQEAEWKNRRAQRSGAETVEPLYDLEDVDGIMSRMIPCPYDKITQVNDCVSIRLTDVGHLLGSAAIEVWLTEGEEKRKICFSGDIGNTDQPILRDPQFVRDTQYLVMESTYGDRLHPGERPDYVKELAAILDRTFARGGNVVIPSFAIGRTQEVLYFIRLIKRGQLVTSKPDFKVFVDSPLAVEATEIFERNQYDCYDDEALELIRKHITR